MAGERGGGERSGGERGDGRPYDRPDAPQRDAWRDPYRMPPPPGNDSADPSARRTPPQRRDGRPAHDDAMAWHAAGEPPQRPTGSAQRQAGFEPYDALAGLPPLDGPSAPRGWVERWSERMSAVLPTRRAAQRLPARGADATHASVSASAPRRRLWRWIAVVLAALLVLTTAGAALYKLDHAPEEAASQFCADVAAARYAAAYDMLATRLRTQLSRAAFEQIGAALDAAEGRVIHCGTAASGALDHTLFSSSASVAAQIARAGGGSFAGSLGLVNESGWKIAAITPGLAGANLAALDAVNRFCTALRTGDTARAFGLATASAGLGSAQQFTTTMGTWAQVDGAVTGCALAGIGPAAANGDATAQLTLVVVRAHRGTAVGALTLAPAAAGGWRVTALGPDLLGSNLGPLTVGTRFCAALASGDYGAAYALFSSGYASRVSAEQFATAFAAEGGTWSCAARLATYAVAGSHGSYDVALRLTGTSVSLAMTATLAFVQQGSDWRIDDVIPRGA
ncbi:MAG: hypothetical protein ACHQ4H_04435 [Ktedonobacterales bacterium]